MQLRLTKSLIGTSLALLTVPELPQGSQVKSISPYGASYWTRTAEIQTQQADESVSYFLKVSNLSVLEIFELMSLQVTQNDTGRAMVSGEYVSMKALHDTLPTLTPRPIAWGTYAADANVHFFLCGFVDMTDDLPDVQMMGASLAELHKRGLSPNGKYGFSVPTLQGTIPQHTDWCDSWEEFFSKSIRKVMENEERSQGADLEVQELCEAILSKVVPRLLRPLETGGRQIRPRLVHGDIWDGNVSTDTETDKPVIFDATCIYAHNELELAPLRPIRHRMGKPYVKAYFKHFPVSDPEEDQDDRNALYCLRWDLNCSTLYPGNLRYRKMCVDVMRTLVAKYADGYEGWAKARGKKLLNDKDSAAPSFTSSVNVDMILNPSGM
ncbi:uncharacterized protein KY384_009183 [Bacidia gigantensis]|uniref:uncharacterized protein n=1 Tax=Bacidia gigantensis TaxID=2732470 RepID=UPI001D037F47|nr:uncharacterized protein KY384_009183 [Bacidia gigantensis]KAG8525539.1 hypothetical protein KY384_009183 [Bacidia gigantensis]